MLSNTLKTAVKIAALVAMTVGAGTLHAQSSSSITLTTDNALEQMSPGWNLGNSLEVVNGSGSYDVSQETLWGNAATTQELINGVKAAGFNSVRIPAAWHQYADAKGTIRPFWLKRVQEVVDYALKVDLYVVLNIHWDGGWMQPTYAQQAMANARLESYWTQIATHFKDYDDRLLFAGTNEIHVENLFDAPSAENCEVQNGFNQVFVDTVRKTGGHNAERFLVVQGYVTNIDYTLSCNATLPSDSADKRLMMEVHYYDPYNFTLNKDSTVWQWGKDATDPAHTETWADETYTDRQFAKVKAVFVDKGVPVILGEYSAMRKTEHDAASTYRHAWNAYITGSAYRHGLIPMYWDNGYVANHQSGLFDRKTGAQGDPEAIRTIVEAVK